jgi:Ni/Co efflux regulator RcnB
MIRNTQRLMLIVAMLAASVASAADLSVVFSKDEIAIIQGYYAQSHDDAGQGEHKQHNKQQGKPLPPGIAKNLARGKPLPPGIAMQRLPQDLERALPPVHPGYERVVVDGRVLLVEVATQVIHDVLMEAVL